MLINTDKVPKPKMIIFDYGETLVNEPRFDDNKALRAVLKKALDHDTQIDEQFIASSKRLVDKFFQMQQEHVLLFQVFQKVP